MGEFASAASESESESESRERLGVLQPSLSIAHKFRNRAWEPERRSYLVILSAVFEAKDLTKPDKDNPNGSGKGGCRRPLNRPKKEGRLLRESHG